MQTEPLAATPGRQLTLASALAQVQHFFPGSWYAPQRWPTADGCMPYQLVWAYARMVPSLRAMRRLDGVQAILVGRGGPEAARMAEEDELEIYPQ
jgi:hypothetical protein